MKKRGINNCVLLSIIMMMLSQSELSSQDLNNITGSGFNIATGYPAQNGPENTVIMGIQNYYDINYKWQLVNAHSTNNYYLRSYVYGWGNYYKIWHSGNFSPSNFLGKNTLSISSLGNSNTFSNGQTFAYASSGTPWNGALISFGGFSNEYDCQISSDYGPHGGNHISFRTRNGDAGNWNSWNEIFHSGNFSRSDVDFTCRNLFSAGNVGIGIPSGNNYKLNVWGKIRAHEIVVNTDGADFVFEPTYKLRTLNELEAFIKQHKHLPEIAPAKEMQENGVSAGEMQTKLLQKVEELTLYVIELKKENEQLKEEKSEQQIQQLKMLMELKKEIDLLKKIIQ